MNKNLILLSFFFTLILFQSCAIQKRIPLARFESPEINYLENERNITISGGIKANREITISNDTTSVNPILDPPKNDFYRTIGGSGKLAVLKNLELGLDLSLLTMPRAQAKVQLLGPSHKEAKKGDFSIALSGGGWYQNDKNQSDDGLSRDSNYSVEYLNVELMSLLGYRLSDQILVYGGPSFNLFKWDGNLKQTNSSSVLVYETNFKGVYQIYSFDVGFEFFLHQDRSTFIRTDLGINQFHHQKASIGYLTGGASLGILL